MSKVVGIYDKIRTKLDSDANLENEVATTLIRIVTKVYHHAMGSEEGYCYKFHIPSTEVYKFFELLDITQDEVRSAFASDWVFPENAFMYNDSYYHILLLLTYYGLVEKKDIVANNAFLLLTMKMWNGRKEKYVKYCDAKIMRYVVNNMMTKRHLLTQFDSPLSLLKQYFVPLLLQKYGPNVNDTPGRLKNLFMQTWARIDQLFVQNRIIDRTTGKSIGQGGILPLYKKAKEEGFKMSTPTIDAGRDTGDEPSFDQYGTTSVHDEITKKVADFVTLNPNPKYSEQTVNIINKETKVSKKIILQILSAMHNHAHYDIIQDIVTLILGRLKLTSKNDICSSSFYGEIKRKIISSKNNTDVKRLQEVLNIFTKNMLQTASGMDIDVYSNVQRMQIRNVVIYGIQLNMRKAICNQVN